MRFPVDVSTQEIGAKQVRQRVIGRSDKAHPPAAYRPSLVRARGRRLRACCDRVAQRQFPGS
jgi:hypothetical protein